MIIFKGMSSFGAVRHISDIRADDLDRQGQGMLTLQGGTNKFASQKGQLENSTGHITLFCCQGCYCLVYIFCVSLIVLDLHMCDVVTIALDCLSYNWVSLRIINPEQ